jgi:hypothetical protein
MDPQGRAEGAMKTQTRWVTGLLFAMLIGISTSADQASQLSKVMRAKLGHSQAILAAVVTSDWASLDRESRALALAVRDPAWGFALTEPEYLRQSDAFSRALQDLIEASSRRDLEAAGNAQVTLTASCVRCHLYLSRRRMGVTKDPAHTSNR